jgi:membrane protease subunit (stomatin/prohibitin family)
MVLLSREFIAVPDDKKNQIVFKWPDVNIRKFTRAIVDADEMALFVNTGQVVGTMGPGRHQIDAQELPFLGMFIDVATGGNAYRAELYFVGTREFPGFTFGGRIDDVQDPQTGMIVTLRVFGDYSLQVKDPAALITNLVGTVDVTNNETVAGWVSEQLLKVMRTEVTTQVVRNGWPILGLSVYTPDIEKAVIEAANNQLSTYGVALIRMGNFDVNLSDADEAQLKALAKDTAYSRLAGGFNQYAAGEMALGAGQGMAKGGGADQGAFLAAGLGLGGQMAGGVAGQGPGGQPGPVPPPGPGFAGGGGGFVGGGPAPGSGPGSATAPPAATVTCTNCQAQQPPGSKFCSSCGAALPPPAGHCNACGAENAVTSRFCAQCGQALGPQPVNCPSCGTEVAPGQRFCSSCGAGITAAAPAEAGSVQPGSVQPGSVEPGPVQPGTVQPGAVQPAAAQDGGGQS